jgi:hypothetical protein
MRLTKARRAALEHLGDLYPSVFKGVVMGHQDVCTVAGVGMTGHLTFESPTVNRSLPEAKLIVSVFVLQVRRSSLTSPFFPDLKTNLIFNGSKLKAGCS